MQQAAKTMNFSSGKVVSCNGREKKGILNDSHPVLQVGNLKRTSGSLESESFIHPLVFIKIDPIQYENNPAKPSYKGLMS